MKVKFISENPYQYITYRQLGIPIKYPKQSYIQFRPENEGDNEGVYETNNKLEIQGLRRFIKSFNKIRCFIREETEEIETDKPSIEELAMQKEEQRQKEEEELQAKIDIIKSLFS